MVLDLFDTIVNWDANQLPTMEWRGRMIHSTLPWILPIVERALGSRVSQDVFLNAYTAVIEEINDVRERLGIEITCLERFERTLDRIEITGSERHKLAEELRNVHMAGVRRITSAPAPRVEAIKRMAPRYRLGLLSNFDDTETGYGVMDDTGVRNLFEAIIISAEVGLRKPNPRIFEQMLEKMDLGAGDVLFVGDTPHHDVAGSKAIGMSAAWINCHGAPMPEGLPAPDIVISDLAELPSILGC